MKLLTKKFEILFVDGKDGLIADDIKESPRRVEKELLLRSMQIGPLGPHQFFG